MRLVRSRCKVLPVAGRHFAVEGFHDNVFQGTHDGCCRVLPRRLVGRRGGSSRYGVHLLGATPERQQAAWRFIRFITEEPASRAVAGNSGYTPANQAVIGALKTENADDKNYQVALDQAARVIPWYSWPGKNGNKIYKVLKDMQEAVLLEKKQPKQALEDAAKEVNALLK